MDPVRLALDVGPLLRPPHRRRRGRRRAAPPPSTATPDVDVDPYVLSFRARPAPPVRRLPLPGRRRPPAVGASATTRVSTGGCGAADVVHGTNYVVPPTRRPAVVSVYDCWFLRHPDRGRRRRAPGRRGAAPARARRRRRSTRPARRRPTSSASCSAPTASRSSTSGRSPCPRPPARAAGLAVGLDGRPVRARRSAPSSGARTSRRSSPRSPRPGATADVALVLAGAPGDDSAALDAAVDAPRRRPPGARCVRPGAVDDGDQGVAAAPRRACSPTRRSTRGSGSRSSRPRPSGCRSSRPAPARSPRSPATAPSSSPLGDGDALAAALPAGARRRRTAARALVAAGRGNVDPVLVGGDRRRHGRPVPRGCSTER